MKQLERAFEHLVYLYANGRTPEYASDAELTKVFRLVDAQSLSNNPSHHGKLVMQERRRGCKQPFNHWGFLTDKRKKEASNTDERA